MTTSKTSNNDATCSGAASKTSNNDATCSGAASKTSNNDATCSSAALGEKQGIAWVETKIRPLYPAHVDEARIERLDSRLRSLTDATVQMTDKEGTLVYQHGADGTYSILRVYTHSLLAEARLLAIIDDECFEIVDEEISYRI